VQILRGIILLLGFTSCLAQDVKPNKEINAEDQTIELINNHLQKNYNIVLLKKTNLVLTGLVIKEQDRNILNRTFTNFKIEF